MLKCKAKERETTQLVLLNKNMEDAIIKDHREMKENILSYVDVILSKFWVIVRFEFTTLVQKRRSHYRLCPLEVT